MLEPVKNHRKSMDFGHGRTSDVVYEFGFFVVFDKKYKKTTGVQQERGLGWTVDFRMARRTKHFAEYRAAAGLVGMFIDNLSSM